ncbi:hypothetical protein ACMFMF_002088 [Clarireedia jacksonii]
MQTPMQIPMQIPIQTTATQTPQPNPLSHPSQSVIQSIQIPIPTTHNPSSPSHPIPSQKLNPDPDPDADADPDPDPNPTQLLSQVNQSINQIKSNPLFGIPQTKRACKLTHSLSTRGGCVAEGQKREKQKKTPPPSFLFFPKVPYKIK